MDVLTRRLKEKGRLVGVTDEFVSQVNQSLEVVADEAYFEVLDTSNRE